VARATGLPLLEGAPEADALLLELAPERLELRTAAAQATGAVYVDFQAIAWRLRHASLRGEAVARALGLRGDRAVTVVDATAGLGRDGFLLAWLGAHVVLIERSAVVAALLADGLRRAGMDPRLAATTERLTLHIGAAEAYLGALTDAQRPEAVYLDPMYPQEGTRAQVKKEMQLLRQLLGPEADPAQLLAVALGTARRRVVVKRPLKAPPLSGPPPSHRVEGRSTRFDVYVIHRPDGPANDKTG
jgi:16S rRNA (guanine1516-N2)-methyltransferase